MDNQAAGTDGQLSWLVFFRREQTDLLVKTTAGIPAAGNEAFPGGQSFEAVPGFGNGDGTAPLYHHRFDPNCEGCRRQAYARLQQEEFVAAPQQWESMDPNAQFYELRRLAMTEDEYFQSLSDFEVRFVVSSTLSLPWCLVNAILTLNDFRT